VAPRRITLLTDFGTADGYVGAMKGVIAAIAPAALIDDISHEIVAGDIAAAAWCLGMYWREYPRGSVHVCVVDPGVGGARRALAAELDGRLFVAPDNGVLTRALAAVRELRIVEISSDNLLRPQRSATFHGRDVFAPAAAHLASGIPLGRFGNAVEDPISLTLPEARVIGDAISGEVVHSDRFGNLITNIPGNLVTGESRIILEWAPTQRVATGATYSDVAVGEVLGLTGSAGFLEIAVRDGNASQRLGAGRGARVHIDAVGRGTRTP
jgi:S-adenosyl-L-methionine hydrolase (adenosine-forming)